MRRFSNSMLGLSSAILMTLFIVAVVAYAAGRSTTWKKAEVIPVVLVKPGIAGFVPVEGSLIGSSWSKADVTAVILVKTGIAGFEPAGGNSIGNTWLRHDVAPVLLVEPSAGGFVPLQLLSAGDKRMNRTNRPWTLPTVPAASVIESRIDGDFDGWDGSTVLKLVNGQVWEQTEYYYHYRYSYMPNVLIYKSEGGYKMKVDGVKKAVGVRQLK